MIEDLYSTNNINRVQFILNTILPFSDATEIIILIGILQEVQGAIGRRHDNTDVHIDSIVHIHCVFEELNTDEMRSIIVIVTFKLTVKDDVRT